MGKLLYFAPIRAIITVLTITVKNTILIFAFCFAFGAVGFQRADETKVVRIYGGGGHFDQALAEQLRPNLAKVFAFAEVKTAPLKPLPGTVVAAAPNPEGPKKASSSDHL